MTLIDGTRHEADQADFLESVQIAQAALRVLPDTPPGIAHYLAGQGVSGRVGWGRGDALEVYLEACTGMDVELRRESAVFTYDGQEFTLKLSSVVSHFGWQYDAGDWPELYGDRCPGTVQAITPDELPGLGPVGV